LHDGLVVNFAETPVLESGKDVAAEKMAITLTCALVEVATVLFQPNGRELVTPLTIKRSPVRY
jgi:hypothetical protein